MVVSCEPAPDDLVMIRFDEVHAFRQNLVLVIDSRDEPVKLGKRSVTELDQDAGTAWVTRRTAEKLGLEYE